MAGTNAIRIAGPTVMLAVLDTSHDPVKLESYMGSSPNYVALLNMSDFPVAVKVSKTGEPAAFPSDGSPGDFVLPAYMQSPIMVNAQVESFITAIGLTADGVLLIATPVEYIS